MNSWLDESLVGLLLAASVLYAFAALGPQKTWRRTLALVAALLARAPIALLHSAAQRLVRAAAEKTPGACGGCDNCGSEKGPRDEDTAADGTVAGRTLAGRSDTGRSEIRVPIGNLRARRSQQK